MLQALTFKRKAVVVPAAIKNNASFTVIDIDAMSAGWVTFCVLLGALDIALTALKVQESDDDSTFTDVTGTDFSVSPATLPAATDDNNLFGVQVNMLGRKRYLRLVATMGNGVAGGFLVAWAELHRNQGQPETAADRGFTQELFAG
jgi:hypothetical protein